MFIFLFLVVALAVATRLVHTSRTYWIMWGSTSVVVIFLLWVTMWKFQTAFGSVALSSILGFLGPEFWVAACIAVKNPKNAAIVLGVVLLIIGISFPSLLQSMLMIGILIFAFLMIFKPFRNEKKEKK